MTFTTTICMSKDMVDDEEVDHDQFLAMQFSRAAYHDGLTLVGPVVWEWSENEMDQWAVKGTAEAVPA